MGKIYSQPSIDMVALLGKAMREWHSDLLDADVKVGLILVESEDGEPALKGLGGKPAAAQISIVKPKDRLKNPDDAEILLDGLFYKEATDQEMLAVFDHELTHLQLQYDKQGDLKLDSLGRPVLSLQKDEFVVWGFTDVIRRHGSNAQEFRAFKQLETEIKEIQLELFSDSDERLVG